MADNFKELKKIEDMSIFGRWYPLEEPQVKTLENLKDKMVLVNINGFSIENTTSWGEKVHIMHLQEPEFIGTVETINGKTKVNYFEEPKTIYDIDYMLSDTEYMQLKDKNKHSLEIVARLCIDIVDDNEKKFQTVRLKRGTQITDTYLREKEEEMPMTLFNIYLGRLYESNYIRVKIDHQHIYVEDDNRILFKHQINEDIYNELKTRYEITQNSTYTAKQYFADWNMLKPAEWSWYGTTIRYSRKNNETIEIGLYNEKQNEDDKTEEWTLNVIVKDNNIFCEAIEK